MNKLLALALALTPQIASAATLNGDNVTMTFNPINIILNGTVGAGTDINVGAFDFDFNAGAGDGFTWVASVNGGLGGSTGFTISSLDFSGSAILTGFNLISTSFTGLAFNFTNTSISFTWTGNPGQTSIGTVIEGTFLTTAAVPLPAGLPLAFTGIVALLDLRRRKASVG